eukprot:5112576-Pyramimonas_sp.AAC.1
MASSIEKLPPTYLVNLLSVRSIVMYSLSSNSSFKANQLDAVDAGLSSLVMATQSPTIETIAIGNRHSRSGTEGN